jgi:hypothetical protein
MRQGYELRDSARRRRRHRRHAARGWELRGETEIRGAWRRQASVHGARSDGRVPGPAADACRRTHHIAAARERTRRTRAVPRQLQHQASRGAGGRDRKHGSGDAARHVPDSQSDATAVRGHRGAPLQARSRIRLHGVFQCAERTRPAPQRAQADADGRHAPLPARNLADRAVAAGDDTHADHATARDVGTVPAARLQLRGRGASQGRAARLGRIQRAEAGGRLR